MNPELNKVLDILDEIETAMRMVLIGISVAAATYLEVNKPRPVVLFEVVKGWVTGVEPQLRQTHHVETPR